MAATKARANTVRPAPPRTSSHTRFKTPIQRTDSVGPGSSGPSTLPPPPFESEAAVIGLEWWLDAHMALASELLWLEQLLEATAESGAHADTVRGLTDYAEAVRDALYELYCDAADDRMATMLGPDAALEKLVRDSYAWCARVVALLASVTNGLRSEAGPDWTAARSGFREAAACFAPPPAGLSDAVARLPIDFTSPIEPLRNLPQDLQRLFVAMGDLHATMTKRFG